MEGGAGRRCSVRILTDADGQRALWTAKGTLRREGEGFRLSYAQDGSLVTLEKSGGPVLMTREGNGIYLRLPFSPGETTEGEIGVSPQNRGTAEIRTETADAAWQGPGGEARLTVGLKYVLTYAQGVSQSVSLRLSAEEE